MMKELTKVFNGIEIPTEIIDDENMYFTVSAIARDNGKNITEWKNSKRVKELVRSLDFSNGIKENLIMEDAKGRTKIHNSLFVNFARFISVDFEIASNKIIMDILLGEKYLCEEQFEKQNKQLIQKDETIKQLKKDRNVYGKRRGGNMETVSFVIRDSEAEISKEAFNVLLCEEGLIGKDICEYCNRSEYFAKDRFSKWQGNTLLVHVDSALDVLEKYNVKKIVNTQQTFDF